jgi:tRNA threonylcarbamoyl adenosine modification protein (Sua5/YciO/YrdC/YwlC family)
MRDLLDAKRAVEVLAAGGVVALPTDTVYGVAASLDHPEAIAKLFAMKRRPSSSPLPVLVDSRRQISRLGVTWPATAQRLTDAFWPGPLTVIVHVPHELALRVGSTTDTAGFRIPDDYLLRTIIEQSGPLAVSSANAHGEPPCCTAIEVLDVLGDCDGFDGVVDDGQRSGEVSTVVDLSSAPWQLVREGSISAGVLARILD